MIRVPTHDTINTSDTIAHHCVQDSPGLNRLRACETSPVLRTVSRPGCFSEQSPCSENGGDLMIQLHLITNDADADTPSDQSLASEGAESEDMCKGAGHPCSPSASNTMILRIYTNVLSRKGMNNRVSCLRIHQLHCELEANANTKMHIHWM